MASSVKKKKKAEEKKESRVALGDKMVKKNAKKMKGNAGKERVRDLDFERSYTATSKARRETKTTEYYLEADEEHRKQILDDAANVAMYDFWNMVKKRDEARKVRDLVNPPRRSNRKKVQS